MEIVGFLKTEMLLAKRNQMFRDALIEHRVITEFVGGEAEVADHFFCSAREILTV